MSLASFVAQERYRDVGIFILRVGLGLMMTTHGWGKFFGGPSKWEGLGGAMEHVGITFLPTFWGFAASVTELFGGLLLALGVLTRVNAGLLAFAMFVATMMHLGEDHPWSSTSHPIETGIGFLALLLIGGGRYSADRILFR